MWIDLTKTITDKLSGYGDDPQTSLQQIKTVSQHGYSLFHLSMGMHTGTHIDGPRHMLDEGPMIDEIPLDKLIGQAVLIDASNDAILTKDHKDVDKIFENSIVLVCGGDAKTIIDDSFAGLLVRKKVKILGIDFASPDEHPYDIHKLLFANGIFILEHLAKLEQLLNCKSIEIVVAPLKVHTDGAVARVYANIS